MNFGRDEKAVAAATEEVVGAAEIRVRGASVPIQPPRITRFRRGEELHYIEFSVHPRGIGYGGSAPLAPFATDDLTRDDFSSIGNQLYDLLRRFTGFQVAIVGWDPEEVVNICNLESERLPDESIYELDGLVLADHLVERWKLQRFVPFSQGMSWLPYGQSQLR